MAETDNAAGNPYRNLPDHCFWSRSHRGLPMQEVDPVVSGAFKLTRDMRIATAGSCFAQHIARHLAGEGYAHLVTETPHPVISDDVARRMNYGVFTARYGNLYTARQLSQLAERANGAFVPHEDVWEEADGSLIDPFRPAIQPGGFVSRAEFEAERETHFAAVRRMMAEAEVFVFTFGLTEAWVSRTDGAVFPLAPGVSGGRFDPERHAFANFSVAETVADFEAFLARLRAVNPTVRVLMTVSPVPLIATARPDRSVISATAYSKAVLRVACEELERRNADCTYFPSYEVITGAHARGSYYGADLREVETAGVRHVMSLFMRHYTDGAPPVAAAEVAVAIPAKTGAAAEVARALDIICDEEAIERASARHGSGEAAAPEMTAAAAPAVPVVQAEGVAEAEVGVEAQAPAAVPTVPCGPEAEGVREIGGPRVALPYVPTGPDTGRGPGAVIGLYSFPKSGNTWLRMLMGTIMGLPAGWEPLAKYVIDVEYDPPAVNPWAFQGRNWYVYKSHHRNVLTEHSGRPVTTDRIVHINRHPLDVFMSYLNFVSGNVAPKLGDALPVTFKRVDDLTPDQMETLFAIFLEHATLFPLNTTYGTVFEHAESFRRRAEEKGDVLDLRYEDLSRDFEGEVRKLCAFLGFQRVDFAKAFEVADQRTKQNGKFFWKRKTGTFRSYLTEDQIARFMERYGAEMKALGYGG